MVVPPATLDDTPATLYQPCRVATYGEGRIPSRMQLAIEFPLTLTLSPEERE